MRITLLPILFCLVAALPAAAQVRLEVQVSGTANRPPAYVTIFSEKDKKTVVVENGKAEVDLIRLTQYVVAVYQKGRHPRILSMDTQDAPATLRLRMALQTGKAEAEDYRPQSHHSLRGGRYGRGKFDLDEVRDKAGFATQMGIANREVAHYYETGELPAASEKQGRFVSDERIRKGEHQLGQEIYQLLNRKRALEMEVERLRGEGKAAGAGADWGERLSTCERQERLLHREHLYYKVALELAELEMEREELRFNQQARKGGSPSGNELAKAQTKLDGARQQAEIARLHYRNKQADCHEIELRQRMENETDDRRKHLREIEISDIRIRQRRDNALKLHHIHNQLATQLTGRERQVELANAQKQTSDHAKAKLALARNTLVKLELEKAPAHRVAAAKKDVGAKEELAYQAEMGYLEHLWHLRNKETMKDGFADALYERQSQLLEFEPLPDREDTEDFVPGYAEAGSEEAKAKALFDSAVETSSGSDERGEVTTVRFKDHYYEIVINGQGKKSYYKNGKPITALTYRFETVAKYGEFLENVRIEPDKHRPFLEFFKKRTNF